MALITQQQAVDHLRLPQNLGTQSSGSPDSSSPILRDLRTKMRQAEALILDYLKVSLVSPPDWDAEADTVPLVVQIATLVQLAELWRFRGDDAGSIEQSANYGTDGQLSPQVTNYLRRWRDPAIA